MEDTSVRKRCDWAGTNELMVAYHDREWGVPLRDDRALFELLILEGAQAGLTWQTVLNKREQYRRAFAGFDAEVIAGYGEADVARLLADEGIIRNRLKVAAAIQNAIAYIRVREETGSFAGYLWQFVGGSPIDGKRRSLSDIPTTTGESKMMSKELIKRGFKFVGPTICYAFMEAAGLVNDHLIDCYRYREVKQP